MSTLAARSRNTGAAWIAATVTVDPDIIGPDTIGSDTVIAYAAAVLVMTASR